MMLAPVQDERVHVTLRSLIRLQSEAHGFSFLPRQAVRTRLTGRRLSSLRGRGLNFEEIRQYHPGDDIRTMDWKVTNRSGRPHVRAYTEERERPALVILDQRQSMFFGSVEKMKSVVAAELASIVAWRIIDIGDRIGALIFNDSEIKEIKPGRHRSDVLHVLKQIERFNGCLNAGLPTTSSNNLNRVLQQGKRLVTHDYLVIVISDMEGWDESSVKSLVQMSRHNDIIVARICDPLESELPAHKGLVVSDGELQIDVDGRNNKVQSGFRQDRSENTAKLQTELSRHNISIFPIKTEIAAINQIRQAIGLDQTSKEA